LRTVSSEDSHTAQLTAACEHGVHAGEGHGIEMPVQRGNGDIEQSRVGNDLLHAAGGGGVEHPMRVDR
jgi:hypothetical protein